MKLFTSKLQKIIKFIETLGEIQKVEIINDSSVIARVPKISKVVSIEMFRPQTYRITFVMGKTLERRKVKQNVKN